VAALALLVASAWATCDTSTCLTCQTLSGCAWFTGGVGGTNFSDCRQNNSDVTKLGLNIVVSCPTCQAGSCSECQSQTGCAWYSHSLPGIGGTCGSNSTTPPSPVGSYSLVGTCPVCPGLTNSGCATCTNNTACGWYVLGGVTGGKCAEASPGFAYSKVTATFCSGNVCAGLDTCSACQNVNATAPATGKPCAWFTPKSGFSAFYNSKCDINETGVVQGAFYDTTAVGSCPLCAGSTCTACKNEANCKWVAVSTFGVTSFGQCVQTSATNPTGKDTIATCPATCQVYSCKDCVAKSECRWYSASGVGLGDTCDRASDTAQHPFTTVISTAGSCPVCKSSRCFECNSEGTCSWTIPVVGSFDVPGFDGSCAPTASPPASTRKVPNTDKKCKGNPNSAAGLAPGLLALAIAFWSL